jgi:hypothetical protein
MAKILLGLSILFMALSAFFGFQTKGKVTSTKAQLATTQSSLDAKTKLAAKLDADTKAAKDEAAAAVAKADAAATELTTTKADAQKAQGQVTELQTQIESKDGEIAKLNETVAKGTGSSPIGEPSELEAKVKEAEVKVAELTQVNQSLTGKVKEAESHAAAADEEKQKKTRQQAAKNLEGQVLAVNQGWNFVVLSIGDHQGVAMNSQLIVKRGDSMVAKVRVSSVEPATSIADIIPGSLARGTRVQAGDRVIYPGS